MKKQIIDVVLPDLGEGIDGAEVSEVSVKVGDTVANGDTILVLESDKASMEIPTETPGTIKELLVEAGAEVKVGMTLAKIESNIADSKGVDPEPVEELNQKLKYKTLQIIDVVLPDLGEGIDGAEVSEVSVKVGDTVANGDTILVLESDKASMEIPTETPGTIKELLVEAGAEVKVGMTLAKIESNIADSSGVDPEPVEEPQPETVDEPSVLEQANPQHDLPNSADKFLASLRATSFKELGIALQQLSGTGNKGRITKDDLNAFIKTMRA